MAFTLALLAGVLSEYVTGHTTYEQDLSASFKSIGEDGYLLGSDAYGRDVATRLLYGARVSLGVAGLSIIGAMMIGAAIQYFLPSLLPGLPTTEWNDPMAVRLMAAFGRSGLLAVAQFIHLVAGAHDGDHRPLDRLFQRAVHVLRGRAQRLAELRHPQLGPVLHRVGDLDEVVHRLGAEFLGTFWLVFGGCGSAARTGAVRGFR